jgi:hypothetical protein
METNKGVIPSAVEGKTRSGAGLGSRRQKMWEGTRYQPKRNTVCRGSKRVEGWKAAAEGEEQRKSVRLTRFRRRAGAKGAGQEGEKREEERDVGEEEEEWKVGEEEDEEETVGEDKKRGTRILGVVVSGVGFSGTTVRCFSRCRIVSYSSTCLAIFGWSSRRHSG